MSISVPVSRRPGVARDPSPDARRRNTAPSPDRGRSLEVVEPTKRRPLRRRMLTLLAGVAVLAVPFSLVLVHVELTRNELRLTTLQAKGDAAQEQYEKLRLGVAQLASPERIVANAEQLGMVTPVTITYLPATVGSAPPLDSTPSTPLGLASWTATKRVDVGR